MRNRLPLSILVLSGLATACLAARGSSSGGSTRLPSSGAVVTDAPGSRDIQRVLDDFLQSWNRHDVSPWAKLFTPDADFVVVTGRHLRGAVEIMSYHDTLHRGVFKERQLEARWADLRLIRSDVAVGHVRFHAFTPGEPTRSTEALATLMLAKDGGRWRIVALHNLLLSGAPGGGPVPSK